MRFAHRRSGPAGSPSMRCRKLRLATYTLAATVLEVFGGSAAVSCAEPLIAAVSRCGSTSGLRPASPPQRRQGRARCRPLAVRPAALRDDGEP